MPPTINIMDGSSLSHKAHRECLPKKKRATCAILTVCFIGGNATAMGSTSVYRGELMNT